MSERGATRTKTEDTSRVFFAVILAIDIVMFCAIAGLEFRAFRLAALTEGDPALEIEIERPEAADRQALWRTASVAARMLYSDGKEAYRKCALCHSIDDPAPNYGPHLGCIARSQIADIEKNSNVGYRFSAALRRHASEHRQWTFMGLRAFVEDPDSIPGARMPFPGLKHDPVVLRDVMHYLYWRCDRLPAFEDLSVLHVDAAGACSARSLEAVFGPNPQSPEASARAFVADPTAHLLPTLDARCE